MHDCKLHTSSKTDFIYFPQTLWLEDMLNSFKDAHILSRFQEILKPHIWFSSCAVIRISSTWPCCENLARAAVWRDLQILKNQQRPTWCQEGWKHKRVLSGGCLDDLMLCVSICLDENCTVRTGDRLVVSRNHCLSSSVC